MKISTVLWIIGIFAVLFGVTKIYEQQTDVQFETVELVEEELIVATVTPIVQEETVVVATPIAVQQETNPVISQSAEQNNDFVANTDPVQENTNTSAANGGDIDQNPEVTILNNDGTINIITNGETTTVSSIDNEQETTVAQTAVQEETAVQEVIQVNGQLDSDVFNGVRVTAGESLATGATVGVFAGENRLEDMTINNEGLLTYLDGEIFSLPVELRLTICWSNPVVFEIWNFQGTITDATMEIQMIVNPEMQCLIPG